MRPLVLASALLALSSCGGGRAPCHEGGDFSSCVLDGAPGVCLADTCVALPTCAAGGCDGAGPTFRIPDTNLRACMGTSGGQVRDGTIPCPPEIGTPACADTDYCGGDAQYGWDTQHPASARFARVGDGAEPVVRDAVTGLEWMGCVQGQRGANCAGDPGVVDGYEAESLCGASSWGGHDDWVLPDAHALQSIVDYGRTSPSFDLQAFPNTPSGFADDYEKWWIECAWTRTSYARRADVAWAVITNNGDVSQGSGVPYHLNDRAADGWEGCTVRCVRAHERPAHARFVTLDGDLDEPVVADLYGGRMWMGCSAGQRGPGCDGAASMLDWRSSLSWCEAATWGGFSDWRLPDVKELRSLVDETQVSPAIDGEVFPSTPHYGPDQTPNIGNYWSSTARTYNDFALYVDFGTGFSHFYVQSEARHARCVRAGPGALPQGG
jgi:hypothetical protein